jgi:predicted transcriptional regulator
VKSGLGPLERQVLEIVCQAGNATVKETVSLAGRQVAYTTIMTTMDRLYRKGILCRRKSKRAFIYSSGLSVADVEKQTAKDLIAALLACRFESREEFVSLLLSRLAEHDPDLVPILAQQLAERPVVQSE